MKPFNPSCLFDYFCVLYFVLTARMEEENERLNDIRPKTLTPKNVKTETGARPKENKPLSESEREVRSVEEKKSKNEDSESEEKVVEKKSKAETKEK